MTFNLKFQIDHAELILESVKYVQLHIIIIVVIFAAQALKFQI